MNNRREKLWKYIKPWLGTAVLLTPIIYYTTNKGQFTFIDYINLLIHKGGHGVFKIFGKVIYTLSRTPMQLIIPSIIYYLKQDCWNKIN